MALRGSTNYIWFETDVLGQGATGAVYKARHKRNGELFAVKTFNHMSQLRPLEVQMREFQVLQKINHENIVRLLAIEEESLSQSKVIIMELCTGGSLYNLLEDPQNSFGLPEREFFSVLGDVASGLKHLRELGIVHRDIKPGNIMLYCSEDGRHIYKLTDFGAARELEEEEQFMSLYGTEEYLFPDMYARAVLRRPTDKPFDASVDLWSLGVTLYHVVTGQLPFRPYGGRSNKHTMYQMTADKAPGVLSGVQHAAGGPIEWSRELPSTCFISKGAKLLIIPLLAGLMESREDLVWSFEKFFEEVNQLLKKKIVYVFNSFEGNLLHLFLDPSDKLPQFQEAIAKQTDIPAPQQSLILERGFLLDHANAMTEVKKYPPTSPTEPLFLFYKSRLGDSWDFPAFLCSDLPKAAITFTSPVNYSLDYSQSKTTLGIIHLFKHSITTYHKQQTLVCMAARVFLFILCSNICRIQTFGQQFAVLVEETQKRVKWFRVQHEMLCKLLHGHDNNYSRDVHDFKSEGERFFSEISDSLREVSEGSDDIVARVDDFHARVVKNGELAWEHISEQECGDKDICFAKIELLINEVNETVKNFRNDKKKRTLTHNEEQIHKFERHKAKTNCDKASAIFQNGCFNSSKYVFRNFADWFKWSSQVSHKLDDVETHMAKLTDIQATVSQKMDVYQSKHLERLERILTSQRAVSDLSVATDLEQEYVVFNKEDAPLEVDPETESVNKRTSNKHVLVKSLNRQVVSLKTDTEDVRQWLRENTSLLQELRSMVEEG